MGHCMTYIVPSCVVLVLSWYQLGTSRVERCIANSARREKPPAASLSCRHGSWINTARDEEVGMDLRGHADEVEVEMV